MVIGCARLARLGAVIRHQCARAGAAAHVLTEDARHLGSHAVLDHAHASVAALQQHLPIGGSDFLDRSRRVIDAAVREGRVDRRHLERRDAIGAERKGGHGLQRRRAHAETLGHVDNVGRADVDRELRVHGVVRGQRGVLERDGAGVRAASRRHVPHRRVVVGLPRERCRHVRRGAGVDALLNRRGEGDRLERRAGLAAPLRGEVELVLAEVARGGHGHDLSGLWSDRDDRSVGIARGLQHRAHRGARLGLQLGIERRRDLQAAGTNAGRADVGILRQLIGDVTDKERLADLAVDTAALEVQLRGVGLALLLRGDHARLTHCLEHLGAPLERGLRVLVRVVGRRQLWQAREQRGLWQRQVLRRLGEVGLRGSLHAVRVVAVEDGVQVRRQDLVFGEAVLKLHGQHGLAQLSVDRLLLDDVDLRDQLLRQRRAALNDAAGHDVLDQRAGNALRVDATVLVVATVLDRDRALLHPWRDLVGRDGLTILLVGEHAERGAASVIDLAVGANLTRLDGVERRQVIHIARGPIEKGAGGDHRNEGKQDERARERTSRTLLSRWASGRGLRHSGRSRAG